jgi:glycine/D-amino acid oxidase-like deaminating enzyme
MLPLSATPTRSSYDVVIIGGAIMGSSTAWFLSENPDFTGSVLVVEKDPTYEKAATMLSTSCMRQQFSMELNVRISQFGADFVKNLRGYMGGDERVPNLGIRSFGYMYMADNENFAGLLRDNQVVQLAAGAKTATHFTTLAISYSAVSTGKTRATSTAPPFSIGVGVSPANAAPSTSPTKWSHSTRTVPGSPVSCWRLAKSLRAGRW